LRLVIEGAPRTKKNSQRILRGRGGRPFVAQSKQHDAWANAAVLQLRSATRRQGWPFTLPIVAPVNVRALVYRARAVGDLLNYLAAVSDALEAAGVVQDDKLCVSWDGSRLLKDAARPRIEITLEAAT
jgi:Holliday junction resolvase RusA-like endonuclease